MKVFYFFIIFSLSSCCTKMDCESIVDPDIFIKVDTSMVTGFSENEIQDLSIVLLDKDNKHLDSFIYVPQYNVPVITLNNSLITSQTNRSNFESFNYLIKMKSGQTDTISDITIILKEEKIDCNKCFLRDGRVTTMGLSSFYFNWNGEKIMNQTPTVLLTKK